MPPADWPPIERALERGQPDELITACAELTEERRTRLWRQSNAAYERFALRAEDHHLDETKLAARRAQDATARLMRLCLGAADVVESSSYGLDGAAIECALFQRPRPWRQEWIELQPWRLSWSVLRKLIRSGACRAPRNPDYIAMMVRFVGYEASPYTEHRDIRQGLLADPDLLEDDVYRVFEINFGFDPDAEATQWQLWSAALLELADHQQLDWNRLLDGVLAGLQPVVLARTARDFSAFHGRLKPSIDDIIARMDVYLRLLESPNHPAVELALRTLKRLLPTPHFDANAVLHRLMPALTSSAKDVAARAVRLAGAIAEVHPALADTVLDMAFDALAHDSAEVQNAVAEVIETNRALIGPARAERLNELLPVLDPAVRARITRLRPRPARPLRSAGAPATAVPRFLPFDRQSEASLDPSQQIRPVADLAELLDLTASVLERQDNPEELERWCDGIARFSDQAAEPGRHRALLRRARRVRSWDHRGAFLAVGVVCHYWLTGDRMWTDLQVTTGPYASSRPMPRATGLASFLTARMATIAARCERRQPSQLLSAPTHPAGWIEPTSLARRLEAAPFIYDADLALALLRLPPHPSTEAVTVLATLPGESASVTRAALGLECGAPLADTTLPMTWRVAAERRAWMSERAAPSKSVELGPSENQAARVCRLMPGGDGNPLPADLDLRRWAATVWPANRGPFYDAGLRLHDAKSVQMTVKQRETLSVCLDPMLNPDEPLESEALNLLAYALGANSDNRLRAAEVLVEAIATRRLDVAVLGRLIAANMAAGVAPPDRWVDGLREAASAGPLHAHEVQACLESVFAELGPTHRRAGAIVDLLRVLAQNADARVSNTDARRWLESIPTATRAGAGASAALAVSGNGSERSGLAADVARAAEQLRSVATPIDI